MARRKSVPSFFVIGISKKTGQIVRFNVSTRAAARRMSRGLKNVRIFDQG